MSFNGPLYRPKIENGSGLMHFNSVDTGDGKDKEDMEMDEGNEEEDEDEMDSAPLDFTKPGRVHIMLAMCSKR